MIRILCLFVLLAVVPASAFAADPGGNQGGMGNMNMPGGGMSGMDMPDSNAIPNAQQCAEMQAEKMKGTLAANMQSMMDACKQAAAPAPGATQER